MSRKIPKWIKIDGNTGEAFCERCGQREKIPIPAPIDVFLLWGKYFGAKHEFCKGGV